MRALVTGASGFLGAHVVAELIARGHAVRALVRPAAGALPAAWDGRAEVVRADLRALPDAHALLDDVDTVVHLAAVMRGTAEAQFAGTVVATERLLEWMRRSGGPRRLVLASSYSVYDWSDAPGRLDEGSALEARPFERDGYAIAKIWQERVVRRLARENGWTLTVLRPGFVYGPGGPVVAGAGLSLGRAFLVVGPMSRLPLTHVRNCATAFAIAAERSPGGTYNVVDAERISAWRYAGALVASGQASWRIPLPYSAGLGVAYLAKGVSRVLFPPSGGKLPGVLIPRRYRARFRPLCSDAERARAELDWRSEPLFGRESPT